MQIVMFVYNDISLANVDPVPVVDPGTNTIIPAPIKNQTTPTNTTTPTNPTNPTNPTKPTNQTNPINQTSPTNATVPQLVVNEQVNQNSGFVPVDPNSIFYQPANNLINQDTNSTATYNVVLNVSNPVPTSVD